MQKNITLSEEIDSEVSLYNKESNGHVLQPSKETLKKILQFAAGYRATKLTDNTVIDICLN
ncbi:hypothetical protein LJB95_00525 [Paludibacteraceae bacterium OttesenSCG-928-F17]|nr:hypothetical protein [Paludibacteraceae bacterium OttesenSCG-928-F17]